MPAFAVPQDLRPSISEEQFLPLWRPSLSLDDCTGYDPLRSAWRYARIAFAARPLCTHRRRPDFFKIIIFGLFCKCFHAVLFHTLFAVFLECAPRPGFYRLTAGYSGILSRFNEAGAGRYEYGGRLSLRRCPIATTSGCMRPFAESIPSRSERQKQTIEAGKAPCTGRYKALCVKKGSSAHDQMMRRTTFMMMDAAIHTAQMRPTRTYCCLVRGTWRS